MKLLTSKQAAESWADGGADGEGTARLGYERKKDQPVFMNPVGGKKEEKKMWTERVLH